MADRNRQIEELIHEHQDLAIREFRRVVKELVSLRKEVKILREIAAEGAQQTFPWFRLPAPKMKQVELVLACLNEHKTYNISQAVHSIFNKIRMQGGYETELALKAYCYSIKLDIFRKK